MGQYSDLELLILEKLTKAISDIIEIKTASQWDKDKLMFSICINEKEKGALVRKEIKKMQKKISKCSPDIAGFLRCFINPSELDLGGDSLREYRFRLIKNFLSIEVNDVLEVLIIEHNTINKIENIDNLFWQEIVEDGLYGMDNKFMMHFVKYMSIADRLKTFNSFLVQSNISASNENDPITDKLFKYLNNLEKLNVQKNNEYEHEVNTSMNPDFTEIDILYDIDSEPWQQSILIEIDKIYKKAKEHNIYFFDCPFEVYKNKFNDRKKEYFTNNIDGNELDFLQSEITYFSKPQENRTFKDSVNTFYYNGYFITEEKHILSFKRKLEYLNKKLKAYMLEVDLSILDKKPIIFENIKLNNLKDKSNYKNPMINDSTWDYPLNNHYKWYELILNSFKTKTDTENPKGYFKTEYLKRDDIFDSNRFYNLILEYANNLKKAFLDLSKNGNALPNNANNVLKQLYDCKHIWAKSDFDIDNLFNNEKTAKVKNELKINEDNFDEIISGINSLLHDKKSNLTNDKENTTSYNFKDLVPDINRQKYTFKILEDLSITANGKFNLSKKRKGALRGVVEALRGENILSDLSLEKLNNAIAFEIDMVLKSKLDWSKTSDDYKNKAIKYIKKNPFFSL